MSAGVPADGETNLHAMYGYGFGELGIDQPKYEYAQLNSRSHALTLSGNKQLFSSTKIFNGHTELNVYGESWLEHQSIYWTRWNLGEFECQTHIISILRTEGNHLIEFRDGATLNPQFSVGYRSFDEIQSSQFGLELIGDINYVDPIGISLFSKWRYVVK